MDINSIYEHLDIAPVQSAENTIVVKAFLKECAQDVREDSDHITDVAYKIAGLMSTAYAKSLSAADAISQIMTIAGELETTPDNKDDLLAELLKRIDNLH